jgi:hypothetical protein
VPAIASFWRSAPRLAGQPVEAAARHQYLTALRSDAVPIGRRSAEDEGALAGDYRMADPAPGLPLVNALRYDSGVQVHVGSRLAELSVSLTNGTLAKPLFRDDNGGKQLTARLALNPTVGLVVGVSGAHGAYLARAVDVLSASRNRLRPAGPGADVEYCAPLAGERSSS